MIFSVGKGPQYSNLDYTDIYSKQLDAIYRSYPETDATFVLSGYSGLNSSISGMILKPWDQRKRSVNTLTPLVQSQLSNIAGMSVFAFNNVRC